MSVLFASTVAYNQKAVVRQGILSARFDLKQLIDIGERLIIENNLSTDVEMAPLEWLTPRKVNAFLDRFGALVFFGLGLLSLYQGVSGPQTDVYFGVSAFTWIGLGWILAGVYFWFSRNYWEKTSKVE